ncbi:MAG: hypothetical protein Q9201_003706 [Fulgogasparrea decipioides]
MLGKRKAAKYVAPVRKRRKGEPAIEEITFDFNDREDYLTGFHKRKLQRIKHAKEKALKKERDGKVAARKALREHRKADLQKHVEAVNATVTDAEGTIRHPGSNDDSDEQWTGIEVPADIDREDDYLDEDLHTVVTVEAVDVSRDGLQRRHDESDGESEDAAGPDDLQAKRGGLVNCKRNQHPKPNDSLGRQSKKRKKKFRYESKAERKVTMLKERSGSKAKARAQRR